MCALNRVTEYLLAGFLSSGRHITDSIAACMEILPRVRKCGEILPLLECELYVS